MADFCVISGTLLDSSGAAIADAKINLRPASGVRTSESGAVIAPIAIETLATDMDGFFSSALAPGKYVGTAQLDESRKFSFDLSVPNLAEAPLADYIGKIDVVVQTSAQLARDQAVAAAATVTAALETLGAGHMWLAGETATTATFAVARATIVADPGPGPYPSITIEVQ